jgi:cytochrome c-type biogenesis protein CcmE
MTDLDDDLKKALEDSEAATAAMETPPRPQRTESGRRNWGLVLSLLVIGGGILAFVFGQDNEKLVYSKQVNEVLEDREELANRNLRVQGILVHGSLVKRETPCEYRFKIRPTAQADAPALDVHYASCIVPDTFRDVKGMDVEVTAEGRLAKAGAHLEATQIFAKCPSKYEMQQRQAAGEQAPHEVGQPKADPFLMGEGDVVPNSGIKGSGS